MKNYPLPVLVKMHMDEPNKNLWIDAGIGAVIIIITDLLVPFMGPLVGGFVPGYIAKGDHLYTRKAGLVAWILAAIVVSIVVIA